jgi:hypothetical protein
MHSQIPFSPPDFAVSPGDESNLISLLCSEKGRRYFGRAFALKAEILSAMQTGSRSQSSIAAEYRVSKQAVGRLAKKARAIYGTGAAAS